MRGEAAPCFDEPALRPTWRPNGRGRHLLTTTILCLATLPVLRFPPFMWIIARMLAFAVLPVVIPAVEVDADDPKEKVSDRIRSELATLDAAVLPAPERATAAEMVGRGVERRFREANGRSSAEWKAIKSREEWETFRSAKLAALRESLGPPAGAVPLGARVTGTLSGEGYRIENVVYQSRPGFWITANLYGPDKPRPSMPGILISHAHHTPKEHGELQDMGVTWARAGCFVLVPDHVGHGERRQHPFRSKDDYAQRFQVGRQDYYFRYDTAIQLHLAGESLIGWMAHDLMRGVDFLLRQENIDSKRIILLGAVAGGGDPAAVTAALDDRIGAAVPFNFGGPQPETRYPLPDDAETSFDYAGGGSWESTRNLRRSAADGFLPWVIVGAIAPRRLVYGHEFRWDRERDPVWKRLQTIYGFYQVPDLLAFTHGNGELRGQPPEATHCTHIGPPHRQLIHAAFRKWFGIEVADESSDRHPVAELQAMTPVAEHELQPMKLTEILGTLAADRISQARKQLEALPPDRRRRQLQRDWSRLLGRVDPAAQVEARKVDVSKDAGGTAGNVSVERLVLTVEPSIVVPVLLLIPPNARAGKLPVAVAVAHAGKEILLRERSREIAGLLGSGRAVCLPDVRGAGEMSPGPGRGRRSGATSLSSSELMLGGTMLGAQLRDLRSVLAWLRTRADLDARNVSVWGDSLAPPNPPDTDFHIPRDDDNALPKSPEPLGGLLALLAALYEDDVRAVYVHGGLVGFESVLPHSLALLPHDAVVHGVLTVGDLCDVVASLAPRRVRLEGMVDGWNRRLSAADLAAAYEPAVTAYGAAGAAAELSLGTERTACAQWLTGGMTGRAPWSSLR
jgi:dienelactone hydrolase